VEPWQEAADAMLCRDWFAAAAAASRLRSLPDYEQHHGPMLADLSALLPRGPFAKAWFGRDFVGHADAITAVAALRDEPVAISAGVDGTIRLWHLDDGACVRVLRGHESTIVTLHLPLEGRTLLSLDSGGLLIQWDLVSGQEVRRHKTPAWMLDGTPDGRLMLWAGPIGITVVQIDSGRHLRTLHTSCAAISISPDGRRAATATTDGFIRLWSVATGSHLYTLGGPVPPVRSMRFAGDGQGVMVGCEDGSVRLCDPQGRKEIRVLSGHTSPVTGLCSSADGQAMASGDASPCVRVWDLRSGTAVANLLGTPGWGRVLAMSPLGDRLIAGGEDGVLRLWHLDWHVEGRREDDWDEKALPCVEWYLATWPRPRHDWNDDYYDRLLAELRLRGYGHVSRDLLMQVMHEVIRARQRLSQLRSS
jgi:WD40 repeat protein